jgi:hypothetical protein
MKGFTKLALVSAIAAMPMSGFAMEALDDSTLSAVTGQDGIRIVMGTDISADIVIHDKDGLTGGAYNGAGAIILDGFGLTLGGGSVTVDIDAGSQAAGNAVLNIAVTTPANMTLALGNLQVAASNGASGTGNWGIDGNATTIANLGSLTLGATSLNIQLGAEPQGNMIATSATITGGISLANFSLNDVNSGGAISMTNLSILNNGGTDLNVVAGINATAGGLVINVTQFGDATNGADLRITDLVLGGGAAVGDIEIQRLDLTGSITISGK